MYSPRAASQPAIRISSMRNSRIILQESCTPRKKYRDVWDSFQKRTPCSGLGWRIPCVLDKWIECLHSPTKRAERKHLDGSIPERVPGKQGEIPRPLGRKMRHKASALQACPRVSIPFIPFSTRRLYGNHDLKRGGSHMASKPNILFILPDQQRPDSLGCYGSEVAITPTVDWLAQTGVRFDNCYVQNPLCCPSRYSVLTGRYPHTHGVRANWYAPRVNEVSFAHQLGRVGYNTAAIGKMHLTPWYDNFGFDGRIIAEAKFHVDCPDDYARFLHVHGYSRRMLYDEIQLSINGGCPALLRFCHRSCTSIVLWDKASVNISIPSKVPFAPSPRFSAHIIRTIRLSLTMDCSRAPPCHQRTWGRMRSIKTSRSLRLSEQPTQMGSEIR